MRSSRLTATCLTLLAAATIRAQNVRAPEPKKALFKYSESFVPDTGLARIAAAIAGDVPVGSWPTVTVRPGETLAGIIDRYYDIYERSNRPLGRALPATTRRLADIIGRENDVEHRPLTVGQSLKVPPLPIRSQSTKSGGPTIQSRSPR